MSRTLLMLASLLLLAPAAPLGAAEEAVDLQVVSRIREEGLHHSQVMETAQHLTDVIGPRVTGSPQMKAANEWTRKKLEEWGLKNAHLEGYPFGRGWSFQRSSIHMIRPRQAPLSGLPHGWSVGTSGPIRGLAIAAKIEKEADFDAWRGKLAGKIVLTDEKRDLAKREDPAPRRHTPETLDKLADYELPDEDDRGDPAKSRQSRLERARTRKALHRFFTEEKVLAAVRVSSRDWGIVRPVNYSVLQPGDNPGVPSVTLAAESYNQLLRLLEKGQEVELEIDIQAQFHDEDLKAYNTIAEIPGKDPQAGVVLAGAHLDSWHPANGATDDAAGCAIMMEAVRILKAIGVQPRRTIRLALWSGEEQGLYGSSAYVAEHFGAWPAPEDPELRALGSYRWPRKGKINRRPDYDRLAAYFNLDNGGGKIRGIYAEENSAVRPIFEAWLAPLRDLGADTVTLRQTGSTDHVPFRGIGLPGFQFIQDQMDYTARTHHSHLDVYDYLERDDLKQAAIVAATFLYHAAMRPEPLPRGPLPRPEEPRPEEEKKEKP